MAKALIFLATDHEEVEMLTVVDILRRGDVTIELVSITGDLMVTSSHNVTIKADCLLEDADFEHADALILPGGMPGTLHLRDCLPLTNQLKSFAKAGKLVAAVCAAPSVLGYLGILDGKKATCYPSFEEKLIGATFVKQPVVVDENIITSRGMGTCIPFAGTILAKLTSQETADNVLKSIIYNDTYED